MNYKKIAILCLVVFVIALFAFAAQNVIRPGETTNTISTSSSTESTATTVYTSSSISAPSSQSETAGTTSQSNPTIGAQSGTVSQSETASTSQLSTGSSTQQSTSSQSSTGSTSQKGLSINATAAYYDAADSPANHNYRMIIYDLTLTNTGNVELTLNSTDIYLVANTYYNAGGGLTGTYNYPNVGVPADVARPQPINGTFSLAPSQSISGQTAYELTGVSNPFAIVYNDTIFISYAYNILPIKEQAVSVLNYSAFNVNVTGANSPSDFQIVVTPANVSLLYQNQPETGFYQGEIIALNANVTYAKSNAVTGSVVAINFTDTQDIDFITSSISPSLPINMIPGSSVMIRVFLIAPTSSYSGGLDLTVNVTD